jgi:hypothetical protein
MKKILAIFILLFAACRQSYTPPIHSTNNSYLVVEGFINNGQDSTYITVTHTFKLIDTSYVTPELHAQLTVEGKDNSSYPLKEWGNGQYGATSLVLNKALQYRLHIKTSNGKEYASEYVDLKSSPPIDSVSFRRTRQGVEIDANSHDPQSASHYYRWDYVETWEFHSVYGTDIQYLNHMIVPLFPNPYYTCWKYAANTNILLTSTTKLASDVVSQFPLVAIPENSWIISVRYSILVKQYVLTPEAYNFWLTLQKNTEQIGSIFSPQPTALTGNVHNLADSSETVIGFISAGTLQKQRIFITPGQIPNWRPGNYEDPCPIINIPKDSLEYFLGNGSSLPLGFDGGSSSFPRYDVSGASCVDCTLTGTNIKPLFWP